MAHSWLVNPVQINVGNSGELVANENITQRTLVISEGEKMANLERELSGIDGKTKVIVFCNTKRVCQEAAKQVLESLDIT